MLVVILSVLSLTVDLVTKEPKQAILTLPSWKLFLAANLIICTCTKVVVSRVNSSSCRSINSNVMMALLVNTVSRLQHRHLKFYQSFAKNQ